MDLDYLKNCIGWARTDERSYPTLGGNLMGFLPVEEVAELVKRYEAAMGVVDAVYNNQDIITEPIAQALLNWDPEGQPVKGFPHLKRQTA